MGADAVRVAWTALFTASPDGMFTTQETIDVGERMVVPWRYSWGDGHVRDVDVFKGTGWWPRSSAYVKG